MVSNFTFCLAKIRISLLPLNHFPEVRLDTRIIYVLGEMKEIMDSTCKKSFFEVK